MKKRVRRWLLFAHRLRASGFKDDLSEAIIVLADEVLAMRSKIESLRQDRTAWRRVAVSGMIKDVVSSFLAKSPHDNHDHQPEEPHPEDPSSPCITSDQGGHPDVKNL